MVIYRTMDTGNTTSFTVTTNVSGSFGNIGNYVNFVTEVQQPKEQHPVTIEIDESGRVTFFEKRIIKETNLENLLKTFEEQKPLSSGLLPQNCINYTRRGRATIYVIEEFPGVRKINYQTQARELLTNMPISVPFLYWVLVFNPALTAYVRCSKRRLKTLDDPVFHPPLLNVYDQGSGKICAGDGVQVDARSNLIEKIEQFTKTLWGSNWNHDLTPGYPAEFNNYPQYIRMSSADPTVWSKLSYRKSDLSINQLLMRLSTSE